MNSQPKALYLLNFVSMWEYFSYYGMRVLLVLFMIHEMGFNDSEAFGLYALYITLLEFGGVVGGWIADKVLGLKPSIAIGGWTIALGHLCLVVPESQTAFYLGLGCIVAGTGLFRSNVAALLGKFYHENDPRRDAGFTLYYTGINIGGFLASLLCGIIGEVYGWHAGFGLAGLGMLSGNAALLAGRKVLAGSLEPVSATRTARINVVIGLVVAVCCISWMLAHYAFFAPTLPIVAIGLCACIIWQLKDCSDQEKQRFRTLGLYVIFLIVFYSCEEQLGSSLILFAERHVDRGIFNWVFPAASMIVFNPLTILATGPLLSRYLQKLNLSGGMKIGLSFMLLSAAFLLLYGGCLLHANDAPISLWYAVISIVLIALGEILIGPTVYAAASAAGPKELQGLSMGIVTLGFAMANLFSGYLSQLMAVENSEALSMSVYMDGFGLIGYCTLGIALILLIINSKQQAAQTC